MQSKVFAILPEHLRTRLSLIIQNVIYFWQKKSRLYVVNFGSVYAERVVNRIYEILQHFSERDSLSEDEIFILYSAAWLYDIGMESQDLSSILSKDENIGLVPTRRQFEAIRSHKNLLTQNLLLDSVQGGIRPTQPFFGLLTPPDAYTSCLIEVCRFCSDDSIATVPIFYPVNGNQIRLRLLVSILRLADKLYIDPSRVNLDVIEILSFTPRERVRWWCYQFAHVLPITEKGEIRFHYVLLQNQHILLAAIRDFIEANFINETKEVLDYLWQEHGLRLRISQEVTCSIEPDGFKKELPPSLEEVLIHHASIDVRESRLLPGSSEKVAILFMAANPSDMFRLQFDEEYRAIDVSISRAEYRDKFELRISLATRASELQYYLQRYKPSIIHFSGHGSTIGEIVLVNDFTAGQAIPEDTLERLFSIKALKKNIKCVVLNACYTESQANIIAQHIDCVVGMSRVITDRAARNFAEGFYGALAFNQDIQSAFDLGCSQIGLSLLEQSEVPKLICRRGDPSRIRLL